MRKRFLMMTAFLKLIYDVKQMKTKLTRTKAMRKMMKKIH